MFTRLAVILVALFLAAVPAAAERRVALVIGNGDYANVGPLANPVNDAKAMAKLFEDIGFSVVQGKTDLGAAALRHALADFEILANEAEVAVIYYSGHGLEFRGQNYVIPVDAAITREVDIDDETVPLDRVLKAVSGATRLKLVILDACRTDPFKAMVSTRSASRGFARIEPNLSNELVAYSAKAGTVAQDGEAGRNSPYTAALLKRLRTPGLDIELALRRVRDDVLEATHHQQEPFYYGSVGGDEVPLVPKPLEIAKVEGPPRVADNPVIQAPERRLTGEDDPASFIGLCDRLAALPADTTRPAGIPGVEFDHMDAAAAVPACENALAARPDDPRLMAQLGRALQKAGGADRRAFDLYRKSAAAGFTVGMNGLGVLYERGIGVTRDETEAAQWYRKAGEAGNPAAMRNLGQAFENGRGVPKSVEEAAGWYRKAAAAGDAAAMRHLAFFYERGIGVAPNPAEAFGWYKKAADGGDTFSMNNLGVMYMNGSFMARDQAEAVRLYQRAAEAGNLTAMRNLGEAYASGHGIEKSIDLAENWYRKAAEAGDPSSMTHLGFLYERGLGVAQNPAEAIRWYTKAGDRGDVVGMNNLGVLYAQGFGVARDAAEALRWYRKAAAAGYGPAMRNLGDAYGRGAGLARDETQALRWYRAAAEAGDSVGMLRLAERYDKGNGVARDAAEALRWFRRAAEAGNTIGMNRVGSIYENGLGVPKDTAEAARWYKRALDAGDRQADIALKRLSDLP